MPSQDRAAAALAFGGLFSLAAAMGIGRFVYTPILPFMSAGLNLPAEDAGLIASANFLGYLVGAVAAASKSLPGNPRFWFLGGLLVSALTSAAMATTTALPAFLLIRFAGGAASAFVLVFSTTLVLERLNTAGRGDLSALHFAGVGCGIAFSALLVAGLGQTGADWRVLWLASGAATLVFLLIAARLVPGEPAGSVLAAREIGSDSGTTAPYLSGGVLRLILAYGLFGFGYVITATFVSVIARTTPALQSTEPFVWLAVGLCAAPSIYVWNRIAARIGARRAFALACFLEACGVALTAIAAAPVLFLLGAALLGATFMGITALGLIEARHQASPAGPAAIRRMLAILTVSFGVGQIVGPWFAGQLHDLTGSFQAPSLAAAAVLLVAAVLMLR
ncbi:YbfB/YjiJ family MFS transporter [Roseibium marinum]|uniref:Putative MFS family arabinose efflux permease n=1 Tax=Roseibium marinum TaxID=281252 RepID=A0A2S3UVJ3_9HYPH|nr:YbfB/YjiJ family MFS transporter [Roseibium marinum]POF31738.1 putative MFS family arabinose efflux permease [Roseibium marinum]